MVHSAASVLYAFDDARQQYTRTNTVYIPDAAYILSEFNFLMFRKERVLWPCKFWLNIYFEKLCLRWTDYLLYYFKWLFTSSKLNYSVLCFQKLFESLPPEHIESQGLVTMTYRFVVVRKAILLPLFYHSPYLFFVQFGYISNFCNVLILHEPYRSKYVSIVVWQR